MRKKQKLPEGYTEERIRAIADYYDNQSDAEGAAEDAAGWRDPNFAWVQVPVELVAKVNALLAQGGGKSANKLSSGGTPMRGTSPGHAVKETKASYAPKSGKKKAALKPAAKSTPKKAVAKKSAPRKK